MTGSSRLAIDAGVYPSTSRRNSSSVTLNCKQKKKSSVAIAAHAPSVSQYVIGGRTLYICRAVASVTLLNAARPREHASSKITFQWSRMVNNRAFGPFFSFGISISFVKISTSCHKTLAIGFQGWPSARALRLSPSARAMCEEKETTMLTYTRLRSACRWML
jgi:hypothetical protein